jgi:hypothetical protein
MSKGYIVSVIVSDYISFPTYQPGKRGERRDFLPLRRQFASDSLPRGGQPPLSLKYEPPYSYFAADLLAA